MGLFAPSDHRALLTGTCFWTLEAVFERVRGVRRANPVHTWLAAGLPPRDSPERHLDKRVEGVMVAWNPRRVDAHTLVSVLLAATSPSLADWGDLSELSCMRSAVFLGKPADAPAAHAALEAYTAQADAPVHTQIVVGLPAFRGAPAYDCGYYRARPDDGFSRSIIEPKLARLAERFPDAFAR